MKNFRIQIIFRIVLVAINMLLASYLFISEQYLFSALLGGIFLIQIYYLFQYIDITNREIVRFLQGINYSDFSQKSRIAGFGKSFHELSDELDKVLHNFRQARIEKDESLKYLETVVDHIGIGLLSFNSKGEIELYNKAAKKILNAPYVRSLSSLDKSADSISLFLINLKPGEKNTFKFFKDGEFIQVLAYGTEFRKKDQNLKLVALHDIQKEMEAKEIEAWQKLIRVLTHEIMNSITPISSLASTVNKLLINSNDKDFTSNESSQDIIDAMNTIQKRSEGLINFVNKYRDISKIPKPNFKPILMQDLFYRIRLLSEPLLSKKKILFTTSVLPEHLEIISDPELLEQVIINLINNSSYSLSEKEEAKIKLTAEINMRGRALLKVADNGPGITQDLIDKIFIPFFTTKKDGSGVGLSISHQIIHALGGTISVASTPNEETIFTIKL